jgi:hypothetical protein
VTDPAAELDGKVTVKVAGDDVEVTRPPFRRLRPLLTLPGLQALSDLPVDDEGNVQGNVSLDIVIDMGEAIGVVLFGEDADEYLDRIMSADQWGEFVSTSIDALQLGEAVASATS